MAEAIKIETSADGVTTVSLARPEKHNAFDDAVIAELTQAFRNIDADDATRVMVLAAQGKSFSAGADLAWMKRMADFTYEENLQDARGLADMLYALDRLSKPTIARVQGAAFGGAVGLVSCCDIAIGTPAAKFCLSEVKLGLVPATISPYVIAAIGPRASRRYFQTAEVITADAALHLGLLSKVVSEELLDEELDGTVRSLLSNGRQAMAASKKLIFEVAHQPVDEALMNHTSAVIAEARVSDESQQRLAAFLEKTRIFRQQQAIVTRHVH